MATEWVILIALAALLIGLFVNLKRQDEAARTLEETWFANVSEPQFYEQRDPSISAAESARYEWEHAVSMIKRCGNRFINESDLHLWLWRATDQNEKVEFSAWQALNAENRVKEIAAFNARKNQNLKKNPASMAEVVWGIPEFDDIKRDDI